jgi:hypothetical protein
MKHAMGDPAYHLGCGWTGFLNDWDSELSLTLGDSQVLQGVLSHHE